MVKCLPVLVMLFLLGACKSSPKNIPRVQLEAIKNLADTLQIYTAQEQHYIFGKGKYYLPVSGEFGDFNFQNHTKDAISVNDSAWFATCLEDRPDLTYPELKTLMDRLQWIFHKNGVYAFDKTPHGYCLYNYYHKALRVHNGYLYAPDKARPIKYKQFTHFQGDDIPIILLEELPEGWYRTTNYNFVFDKFYGIFILGTHD